MAGEDEKPFTDPLLGDEDENREGRIGIVPEFIRKVAVAGMGALFMTEDGLRSLAGQLKLPKEMLGFIVSQAEKSKAEVGRVLSEEIRRFLQSDKLREELLKLVAGMTVEIKAEVRLKPSEGGDAASPSVAVTEVTARRGRKKKE